jgi:hypothetical protein
MTRSTSEVRSYVCGETRLRLLDNSHRVTVILKNVRHGLPSGTIGEGTMDQNDSLDGRVRNAAKAAPVRRARIKRFMVQLR